MLSKPFVPQYEPVFGYYEKKLIKDYMENPGWITEYKKTEEFESILKNYLQVKDCIVVNNGTIAISLALLASGVKPYDYVAVPNTTMVATVTAVSLIGAVPVFVDIREDDLLMDLDILEWGLENYNIKAVIYVSLNGRWDTTGKLMQLQESFPSVVFIEDAAQSFGSSSYRGKIGSSLSISTFSFSVPKIITTGQGGCITTENENTATLLRKMKDFGRISGGIDISDTFGINAKFTELQALLGIGQMKQIEYRTARKRQMYKLYEQGLDSISQVKVIGIDDFTVPWFVDVRVEDRQGLMDYLKDKGIGTRPVYPPLNTQKIYKFETETLKCPISEEIGQKGLWLPSSFTLTDNDIHVICDEIRRYYE